MNIEPKSDEAIDHILDLLLACSGLHYDNHECSLDYFKREKAVGIKILFARDNRLLSSRAKPQRQLQISVVRPDLKPARLGGLLRMTTIANSACPPSVICDDRARHRRASRRARLSALRPECARIIAEWQPRSRGRDWLAPRQPKLPVRGRADTEASRLPSLTGRSRVRSATARSAAQPIGGRFRRFCDANPRRSCAGLPPAHSRLAGVLQYAHAPAERLSRGICAGGSLDLL